MERCKSMTGLANFQVVGYPDASNAVQLEARVHGLALKSKNSEDALVHAT